MIASRARALASARAVLLLSLAVAWLNFALTSRWANIPGTLHGWRRPYYAGTLAVVTVLVLSLRLASRSVGRLLPRVACCGAVVVLAGAFLSWFPIGTWAQVPFLDNWPPRFQSTLEGVALLRRGALGGWQWAFLGGYHTVSDITQNLAVLGFLPMSLLGPQVGFHVLHALLFGAIPLLVFLDLKDEDRDVAWLSAGISCLLVGNFSYMFIRSGDTNSVAGVACTALALFGSHAARRGRAFGLPLLALGLTLTAYSHVGFLAYGVVYLAIEALYYRDRRSVAYACAALAVAVVASLPLTWELFGTRPTSTRTTSVPARQLLSIGPSSRAGSTTTSKSCCGRIRRGPRAVAGFRWASTILMAIWRLPRQDPAVVTSCSAIRRVAGCPVWRLARRLSVCGF
jgi:hypothetical protein